MPNVNILPSDVVAKIAAGEVVDRPASVIKELLENAIDAGATSVEIHLKDAGKELIHIKDNGHGIARENLDKLFFRHATSKIQTVDDLEKLTSMGFRGEALYSIAAVSDIHVRTQAKENDNAWSLHVRGGNRLGLSPTSALGHGSVIKVAELFFNTPARRKFLKNNASEMTQIINVVLPYALIYPSLKILLSHAGKDLLDLRPANNNVDRIAHALNIHAKDLTRVEDTLADEAITIKLTLGNINVQRARRDMQFIFINNRPVDSKNISFNLNDVYKLLLPPGTYGAFIVEIHLDPSDVDVNIHPTKREVRLKGEARLISIIRRLAENALMETGAIKRVSVDTFMQPTQPRYSNHDVANISLSDSQSSEHWQTTSALDLFNQATLVDNTLGQKLSQARFIGSFINKYLIFESGASLLLVDQHAAQERIMFEKFTDQVNSGTLEIQPLLTPLLLKLSPIEKITWEESQENLKTMGIETTIFDDDTVAIQTQPVLLKNIERAVRGLLAGRDIARCDKATLARRACKASIVTGDKLDARQVEHQRQELLACQDPFICPHGRPTTIEITDGFLERQFLRS